MMYRMITCVQVPGLLPREVAREADEQAQTSGQADLQTISCKPPAQKQSQAYVLSCRLIMTNRHAACRGTLDADASWCGSDCDDGDPRRLSPSGLAQAQVYHALRADGSLVYVEEHPRCVILNEAGLPLVAGQNGSTTVYLKAFKSKSDHPELHVSAVPPPPPPPPTFSACKRECFAQALRRSSR